MGKFFIKGKETTGPENWKIGLAEPEKQWKSGYSAKALAYSWEESGGIPPEVKWVLSQCEYPLLREPEMLFALAEHKVSLPGGGGASQNDIFVLTKVRQKLMAITVEGKVRESFNDPVRKWINIITSPSGKSGKPRRLDYLIKKLDIQDRDVSEIRYQLLHRTVSALIMAEQFNAPLAMMLVHSFSQEDEHIKDYQEFAGLFNVKADVNTITFAGNKGGVDLYLAWIRGEERFLRV